MSIEVSPNTSSTRHNDVSIESPDASAIEVGGTEQEKIDHAAKLGSQRANDRINTNKTKVPGSSIISK